MLTITPITRQYVAIDVASTLSTGAPAVISGVDVALVPPRSAPIGTTAWVSAAYSAGTATVLVAGYDADPTGALVVPAGQGADLWIRVVDSPEVTATKVFRILVLEGPTGAETVVSGTPFVTSVAGLTGIVSGPALVAALGSTGGGTVADATTTTKGKVQLAGDLGGTAAAPTVPGLAAKANTSSLAPVATSGVYADLTAKPTIPTVGAAGAGAGVALSSTDASVTNARTPSTHAATHASGGSDPVSIASTQVTGLGTAATQASTSFDASGAAAAAQAAAVQRANHTGIQAATTITGLGAAVAADATARRAFTRKPQFLTAYQSTPTAFATNQAAGISFQHTHKAVVAATDVRLVIPLGASITNGTTATEVLAPAAVPVKASLLLGGVVRPVTFGQGVRSKSCDPGGILISDPIAADLAAGTAVPVRSWHNVTTGQPYPNTVGTGQGPGFTASGDGFTSGTDVSDVTTAMTAQNTTGFVPHGLIGVPVTPIVSIAGVGDSIMMGTGESANNGGFLADAANANYPFLRLAVGGASAQGWVGAHTVTWPLLDYCTHAIVMLGANDLNTSNGPRTFAQFQADLLAIYTALKNRGLKVYGCTILPRTTSNANTTVASTAFAAGSGSVRGQSNAWIRAGGGGMLDGFYETADAVESGRDTGFWASTGLTSDGAHPSATGHAALAAVINLASLS